MAYGSILPQPRESNHLALLDANITFLHQTYFYLVVFNMLQTWPSRRRPSGAFLLEVPGLAGFMASFPKSITRQSKNQAIEKAPGG